MSITKRRDSEVRSGAKYTPKPDPWADNDKKRRITMRNSFSIPYIAFCMLVFGSFYVVWNYMEINALGDAMDVDSDIEVEIESDLEREERVQEFRDKFPRLSKHTTKDQKDNTKYTPTAKDKFAQSKPKPSKPKFFTQDFGYDRERWEASGGPRIVILAGPHKTASTTIQDFFSHINGWTVSVSDPPKTKPQRMGRPKQRIWRPHPSVNNWIWPIGFEEEYMEKDSIAGGIERMAHASKFYAALASLISGRRTDSYFHFAVAEKHKGGDNKFYVDILEQGANYYRKLFRRVFDENKNIVIGAEAFDTIASPLHTIDKKATGAYGEDVHVTDEGLQMVRNLLSVLPWDEKGSPLGAMKFMTGKSHIMPKDLKLRSVDVEHRALRRGDNKRKRRNKRKGKQETDVENRSDEDNSNVESLNNEKSINESSEHKSDETSSEEHNTEEANSEEDNSDENRSDEDSSAEATSEEAGSDEDNSVEENAHDNSSDEHRSDEDNSSAAGSSEEVESDEDNSVELENSYDNSSDEHRSGDDTSAAGSSEEAESDEENLELERSSDEHRSSEDTSFDRTEKETCEDDQSFRSEKGRTCRYIGKRKVENRMKFCSEDDVRAACPAACDICGTEAKTRSEEDNVEVVNTSVGDDDNPPALRLEDIEVHINLRTPRIKHINSINHQMGHGHTLRQSLNNPGFRKQGLYQTNSLAMALHFVKLGVKVTLLDMAGVGEKEAEEAANRKLKRKGKEISLELGDTVTPLGGLSGVIACEILRMGKDRGVCDEQSRLLLPGYELPAGDKNIKDDRNVDNLTDEQLADIDRLFDEYDCGIWHHLKKYKEKGLFRILYPSKGLFATCNPTFSRNISFFELEERILKVVQRDNGIPIQSKEDLMKIKDERKKANQEHNEVMRPINKKIRNQNRVKMVQYQATLALLDEKEKREGT